MSYEKVASMLDYDCESGFLIWKSNNSIADNIKHIYNTGMDYLIVKYEGKSYYSHRIVWFLVTGEEPPALIDHEDGDGMNNLWYNLRDGTGGINQRNRRKSSNNTSGWSNIIRDRSGWKAILGYNNEVLFLGRYSSAETANRVVKDKKKELGFSERHGE